MITETINLFMEVRTSVSLTLIDIVVPLFLMVETKQVAMGIYDWLRRWQLIPFVMA